MLQRAGIIADRLIYLLEEMARDPIAPIDKVHELRASLAEHFQRKSYLKCESMGALVRENLESIRRRIGPGAPCAQRSIHGLQTSILRTCAYL